MTIDAFDPTITEKEIRYTLINVYHVDPYEYGLDEMSIDEMRSLLDLYIRGVQQKIDKLSED